MGAYTGASPPTVVLFIVVVSHATVKVTGGNDAPVVNTPVPIIAAGTPGTVTGVVTPCVPGRTQRPPQYDKTRE